MRQVKYTRPADWVDPFQETSTATSDSISAAADRKSRSGPRRHPRDDLGSINEDSTVDHPEPASTRSLDSSPLTTYRSNGSTASHASASPSRRASSRGKMRSTKIRELRTTHLEQLNKSHGGGDGNHPRYAKRSASSQSLKSNGTLPPLPQLLLPLPLCWQAIVFNQIRSIQSTALFTPPVVFSPNLPHVFLRLVNDPSRSFNLKLLSFSCRQPDHEQEPLQRFPVTQIPLSIPLHTLPPSLPSARPTLPLLSTARNLTNSSNNFIRLCQRRFPLRLM
jgi:hypothetical protein